jgi:hypothetical protein
MGPENVMGRLSQNTQWRTIVESPLTQRPAPPSTDRLLAMMQSAISARLALQYRAAPLPPCQ